MEAEEPLSAKRWVRAAVEQILTFLPDGIDLVVVEGKKNKNKIRLCAFYLRTKKTIFLTVNLLGVELQNCRDVTYLL